MMVCHLVHIFLPPEWKFVNNTPYVNVVVPSHLFLSCVTHYLMGFSRHQKHGNECIFLVEQSYCSKVYIRDF